MLIILRPDETSESRDRILPNYSTLLIKYKALDNHGGEK